MNKNSVVFLQPLVVMGSLFVLINILLENEFLVSLDLGLFEGIIVGIVGVMRWFLGISTFIFALIFSYLAFFVSNTKTKTLNTNTDKKVQHLGVKPSSITLKDGDLFEILISIRMLINDFNYNSKEKLYNDFMIVSDEILKVPRSPENLEFFDIEAFHEFKALKALLKTLNEGISIKDANVSETLSLVATGLENHAKKYSDWKLQNLKEETYILDTVLNKTAK